MPHLLTSEQGKGPASIPSAALLSTGMCATLDQVKAQGGVLGLDIISTFNYVKYVRASVRTVSRSI